MRRRPGHALMKQALEVHVAGHNLGRGLATWRDRLEGK